jgi:hypothetical protein
MTMGPATLSASARYFSAVEPALHPDDAGRGRQEHRRDDGKHCGNKVHRLFPCTSARGMDSFG